MNKRNQRLAVIFVVLLMVNLGFLFVGGKGSGVSFDEDLFTITDTNSIRSVTMTSADGVIELEQTGDGWMLNDTYQADEGLMQLLMSIMQRVTVKKPVDVESRDSVMVRFRGVEPLSFAFWSNPTKTATYFGLDGREEVYEVGIPGYHDYLGQIFELNADQWRDRLILDGSWRTIQELTLDYLDSDDDFTIRFSDEFFTVDNIDEIDSSAVIDYLNQFQYFEANEWISEGRFPRYDSLFRKPPLASLNIVLINIREPILLDIYPRLAGEAFHLVADQYKNLMVIDQRRMMDILKKRSSFKAE